MAPTNAGVDNKGDLKLKHYIVNLVIAFKR